MIKIKSLLFVPARDKMLDKIKTMNADAYIIDLEDSIEQEYKSQALENTKRFLEQNEASAPIFVRVNTDRAEEELSALDACSNIGFMLPKFESPEHYGTHNKAILRQHPIIALIETPMGIVNIQDILGCTWVDAVAFGAEDYTAISNMKNTPEYLLYQKSRLLTYGKAYCKPVYDTPSFQLKDMEALKREIKMSAEMGFDGKLIISPKHIEAVDEGFACHDTQIMKKIIEEYESRGEAVAVIKGNVYEKMHIEHMKRIIRESE